MKSNILYIDLLSLNTYSAKYVAFGHLRNILNETNYEIRLIALNKINLDEFKGISRIKIYRHKNFFENYIFRYFLLKLLSGKLIKGACLLTFSGFCYPFIKNQIALCQNPFPFYKKYHYKFTTKIKNLILRNLFIRRSKGSKHVFNSNHIKSIYVKNSINRNLKKYFLNCDVVYQGVDFDTKNELFSLQQRSKNILFVSGITRHKRLLELVKFFDSLNSKDPSFVLDIIGKSYDQSYLYEIKHYIKENNLSDKVNIYGFVEDELLEKKFKNSFLYISLSDCESFGIPALQAQSYGTPVIVCTGTAQEEILKDTCISIGMNANDFNNAINYYKDKNNWLVMQKLGINNVQKNFKWKKISNKLVSNINDYYI